jgi:hypothetical protein
MAVRVRRRGHAGEHPQLIVAAWARQKQNKAPASMAGALTLASQRICFRYRLKRAISVLFLVWGGSVCPSPQMAGFFAQPVEVVYLCDRCTSRQVIIVP